MNSKFVKTMLVSLLALSPGFSSIRLLITQVGEASTDSLLKNAGSIWYRDIPWKAMRAGQVKVDTAYVDSIFEDLTTSAFVQHLDPSKNPPSSNYLVLGSAETFEVPETGDYTFKIFARNYMFLAIDGKIFPLVSDNGSEKHMVVERTSTPVSSAPKIAATSAQFETAKNQKSEYSIKVNLSKGKHSLDFYFWEQGPATEGVAKLWWTLPSGKNEIVPSSAFGTRKNFGKAIAKIVSATPTAGKSPLSVTFTAEALQTNGKTATFHWDFDGDGTIDSITPNPTIQHVYIHTGSELGFFFPKLNVEVESVKSNTVQGSLIQVLADPSATSLRKEEDLRKINAGKNVPFSSFNLQGRAAGLLQKRSSSSQIKPTGSFYLIKNQNGKTRLVLMQR